MSLDKQKEEEMKFTKLDLERMGWTYMGYVWYNREIWAKGGRLILIHKRTRKVIAGEV